MKNIILRKARLEDFKQITKIYNYHIINGFGTFEEKSVTINEMRKRYNKCIKLNLPFVVYEINEIIIGFSYLSTFRDRSAYRFTYENSIYVKKNSEKKGIGFKLLSFLIKESKKNPGIKNIISVIGDKKNIASIQIHKKVGFSLVGIFKKVGYKKDKWLDVVLMQKRINEKSK